jgi:hypothetical protein
MSGSRKRMRCLPPTEKVTDNWDLGEPGPRKWPAQVPRRFHIQAGRCLRPYRELQEKTSLIWRERVRSGTLVWESDTNRSPPGRGRCPSCQRKPETEAGYACRVFHFHLYPAGMPRIGGAVCDGHVRRVGFKIGRRTKRIDIVLSARCHLIDSLI